MVDLGVRLQQLRMDRNMSQSELGKALNRSKSVISAYENDLRIPPLEVLTEIALIFNVSLDFLVGIDKAEMVSVDGLNDTQKAIIHSLIYEFTNDHSPYPGLTEHQQKLLSQIMVEFSKNNIHRTFAFYCSSPRNKKIIRTRFPPRTGSDYSSLVRQTRPNTNPGGRRRNRT